MISEESGSLLDAPADALVNTVNTVGVMGKGLALQFKQAYPGNFRAYQSACRNGEVRLGRMFVYEPGVHGQPRYLINFPTKGHWRTKSNLPGIRAGLADLRQIVIERGITSIAVPPLGCGNGGLSWEDVRPLIAEALGDLPGVRVLVYPPQDSPPPATMPVNTQRPRMTAGRAALLTLLSDYAELSWLEGSTVTRGGASLLEIQKLMYFLQEAGQPLRLNFVKGIYGPYAENLNHVLQALEGHYLRGYGDRTQRVLDLSPISLVDGAADEARQWLNASASNETNSRIADVLNLITDFASPYGAELLATVHWTASRDTAGSAIDPTTLTATIRAWNRRKERLFTEHHVRVAIDHLKELHWIDA
jgi:O-acetyl-ADP-ribose deacetylase (regulator of RNase III)